MHKSDVHSTFSAYCHPSHCHVTSNKTMCVSDETPEMFSLKEVVCEKCLEERVKIRPVVEEKKICRNRIFRITKRKNKSNYIKGKFCVYVRYRTYLNVVGMGSKLLGVLRRTLRWSSNSQKFKKLILKIRFFKRETQKKRENRQGRQTVTGAGTGNVLDPSNAGYPPLV
jgi:hypothetical protein